MKQKKYMTKITRYGNEKIKGCKAGLEFVDVCTKDLAQIIEDASFDRDLTAQDRAQITTHALDVAYAIGSAKKGI